MHIHMCNKTGHDLTHPPMYVCMCIAVLVPSTRLLQCETVVTEILIVQLTGKCLLLKRKRKNHTDRQVDGKPAGFGWFFLRWPLAGVTLCVREDLLDFKCNNYNFIARRYSLRIPDKLQCKPNTRIIALGGSGLAI